MDVQPYHTTGLRSITQLEINIQVDRKRDRGSKRRVGETKGKEIEIWERPCYESVLMRVEAKTKRVLGVCEWIVVRRRHMYRVPKRKTRYGL